MKRFALLALPFAAAACGDNNGTDVPIDAAIDTAVIDTPIDTPTDTPIDTAVDAPDGPPVTTYSGTISVLEAALLNPGTSGTFFGQGVQAGITFTSSDTTMFPAPLMEEQPGSPLGCKAWQYTAAQAPLASIGLDEGPVAVNSPAATTTSFLPSCVFQPGAGYICPHTGTMSTGGIIAAGPAAGTATLTDADTTFNAGNTSNRYVRIGGATNAANNGVFPILALGGANTIVYGNPAFVAETIPATGFHINLAGVGPTPMAPDPGFLTDTASIDFVHTMGGGGHIPDFTATTSAAGSVGDDFTLPLASLNLLNAIPRDGTAFTVGCADAASCGTASGTLINIVTTDGPTAGLSPFTMPLPTTRRVQVRCASLGAISITVPAAYSALIMGSGATRIQTTFIRPTLMAGVANVTSISGHAVVGFTN